jgi:steroid delta-isomerase-like uncharacterized protein
MSEANKAIARRLIEEAWNKGEPAAVDALVDPAYVGHFAIQREPLRGPEAYKGFIAGLLAAFPDLQFTVEDIVAEGDKVAIRWTNRGTHGGALMGVPPTGRRVEASGIWIHRLAGGKVVEEWGESDVLGMLQQLGVVPAPGQGG